MLKHYFKKHLIKGQTYKPLLHKKGKQWIVIGITGLLLAGFGASTATNLDVNADSTNDTNSIQLPTNNQQRANQQNKWNFVMQGVNGDNSQDDKSSIGTGNTGFHYDNNTEKVIPNTNTKDAIRYGSYRGMSYTADLNKQSIEFTDGVMPNNTEFDVGYTIHQFFGGNKHLNPDQLITNAKSVKIDSGVDTSHVTDIDSLFAELHNLQSFTLPSNFGKNLTSADFALNGTNTFYKKDANDNYTSANPLKVDEYGGIVNFKDLGGTYVANKNVMPNSVKQAKAQQEKQQAEARAKQADASIANSYKASVATSVANANKSTASSYAKSADASIANSYKNSVANSVAQANQSLAKSDAKSADQSLASSYKNSVAKSVQAENASTANNYAQSADKSVANSVKASVAKNNQNIANQQKASVEQSVANMNKNTASRDANQANQSIADSYKTSVADSVAEQNQAIAKQKAQEADQSIANSYKNTEATNNASIANSYAKSANDSIASSAKASVSASVASMNQSIANSYAQSANQSIANSLKNSVATSVKNANESKANSEAQSADASIANSIANQKQASVPESASEETNVAPAPVMPAVQSSAPVASESAQPIAPSSLAGNDTSTSIATKPVQKPHMGKNHMKTVRHINELKVGQVAKYHGKLVKRVRAPKVIKLGRHSKRVHVIGLFVFGYHQIRYEVKIGHHVILINKHVSHHKHLNKKVINKIMKQMRLDKKDVSK